MRGTFATYDGGHVFEPSEIWIGRAGDEVSGVFALLTAQLCEGEGPCTPITERKLNGTSSAKISDVDFEPLNLLEIEVEGFAGEMLGNGLIVAGERYTYSEAGRSLKGRTATAAFARFMPSGSP